MCDCLIKEYYYLGFEILILMLNFGYIYGGDSLNWICGCCELYYDVCFFLGISLDGLDNLMYDVLCEV